MYSQFFLINCKIFQNRRLNEILKHGRWIFCICFWVELSPNIVFLIILRSIVILPFRAELHSCYFILFLVNYLLNSHLEKRILGTVLCSSLHPAPGAKPLYPSWTNICHRLSCHPCFSNWTQINSFKPYLKEIVYLKEVEERSGQNLKRILQKFELDPNPNPIK